jgi:hypothetical protein
MAGTVVNFKIDTGADVSIMSESCYNSLPHKPELNPCNIPLRSPGGKVTIRGQFIAKVTRKHQSYEFKVIVVPSTSGSNLLSREVSNAMGLIRRADEVTNREVYGTTGLMRTKPVEIQLKKSFEPYCLTTARRVPFPIMSNVEAELTRMQHDGIIQTVIKPTDWCAPMVPVVKRNGDIRICVDFKKLNQCVKRPHLMLPNLDDVAPQLAGSTVFSTLDISGGFYQVPLSEKSAPLTTFITPFGRYCFKRVPMGINLGPEEFQRKMQEKFSHLECAIIMDDILVYGKDTEEHDRRLNDVMAAIQAAGVKLNKSKCHLRKLEVTYFGHCITADGIKPEKGKIEAITKLGPPTNVSELRTVLGMLNYLGKFVKDLASMIKPITDLLKADVSWQWGPSQELAFSKAKEAVTTAPALAFYRSQLPTTVSADASSFGLGAVLLQPNKNNNLRPVAFCSRTLTEAEKKYAQIEKEALASVWACEKFEKYLVGLPAFRLLTDHKPLVPLIMSKDLDKCPLRCQRLLMRLMRFNAVAEHVPGKELVIADALSRNPLPHTGDDALAADEVDNFVENVHAVWPVSSDRLTKLRAETIEDRDLQLISEYIMHGWPSKKNIPSHLHCFEQYKGEFSVAEGLVIFQDRITVPTSQREEVLHRLHESHQGLSKCRGRAQRSVWWPGLSQDLKDLLESCTVCQANRPSQRYEPMIPTELPSRPWEKLGTDLLHFKKKDFLVVTDYYSRWIEIKHLSSQTSEVVIRILKQLFAQHGIPDSVRSDNGPCYSSSEFTKFAQEYNFQHETSSPYFPHGNGEAERSVQTAKKLLEQKEPDIALLNYRTTPHSSTGVSPAEALMGRQLRTRVPTITKLLLPKTPSDQAIRQSDGAGKESQKAAFDRRHGTRPLPVLSAGDDVLMKTNQEKKWKNPGKVVGPADEQGRSYLIRTPTGVFRRNRKDLQETPAHAPHAECPEPEMKTAITPSSPVRQTPSTPTTRNLRPRGEINKASRLIEEM